MHTPAPLLSIDRLDQDPASPPPVPTRISALSVSGAQGQKARVTLDDGTDLELDTETVLVANLRKGDPVDAQLRARLVEASTRWRIREAGLRLLAHRARTRRELATRLRKKGFPGRLVESVLTDFEERGWLDDAAFARSWIQDRLRIRPRGRRALLAELRRKGVDAGEAEAALDEAFRDPGVSDRDIALELAEGWLRKQPAALGDALLRGGFDPDAEAARRRFTGYMARRGISGGVIRATLDRLREERA